jgi:hypothetical protein
MSPDLPPEPDYIAFDGEKVIGRVYQHEHGTMKGRWLWTMTDHGRGYPPPFAIHGEVQIGVRLAGWCSTLTAAGAFTRRS